MEPNLATESGNELEPQNSQGTLLLLGLCLGGLTVLLLLGWMFVGAKSVPDNQARQVRIVYQPRLPIENSGFLTINKFIEPWTAAATLEEIRDQYDHLALRVVAKLDQQLTSAPTKQDRLDMLLQKALLLNNAGEPKRAYEVWGQLRSEVSSEAGFAEV